MGRYLLGILGTVNIHENKGWGWYALFQTKECGTKLSGCLQEGQFFMSPEYFWVLPLAEVSKEFPPEATV